MNLYLFMIIEKYENKSKELEIQTSELKSKLKQLQDTLKIQHEQYEKLSENNIAEKNDLHEQAKKRVEYEELYHSTLKQYEDMKILKRKREYEMKELESQRKAEIQNKLQVNAELAQLRAEHKQLANQIEVEESRHKKYLDALQSEVQQLRQLKKNQQNEIKALESRNEMLSHRLEKLNYKVEHSAKKQMDAPTLNQENSSTSSQRIKKWYAERFIELIESSLKLNNASLLRDIEISLKKELAELNQQLTGLKLKQSKNEQSLAQQINDVKIKLKTYKLSNHKQLPSLMEYFNELQARYTNKSFLSIEELAQMDEIIADINDVSIQLSLNQTKQLEFDGNSTFKKSILTKDLKFQLLNHFDSEMQIPTPIVQFYQSFYDQLQQSNAADVSGLFGEESKVHECVLLLLVRILSMYIDTNSSLSDAKAMIESLEQDKEALSNQYHNSRVEATKRVENIKIEYEDKVSYLLQQIRALESKSLNGVITEEQKVSTPKAITKRVKDDSGKSIGSLQLNTLNSIQQSLNSTLTNMLSPGKYESRQSWGSTDSLNLPSKQKS